ncbi:hypothetical protein TGAMA5MH_08213 [Trichoderma gamsii]|uniref:Uncharacterized protein n=1 Tax=Trichoderma gamsii TaxID=398673 RepID=A0A2K0T334_9HYPO|nr:hypothetical protein TGAMA5MH_08213 [Trichoderma gamsii]
MGMFSSKPAEGGDGNMGNTGNTGNDTDRPVIDLRTVRRLFLAATFGRLHKWLKQPPTPGKWVDDGPYGTS